MKNWEKYEEEIKAVGYDFAVVNGKVTRCRDTACSDCKFDHDDFDCEACWNAPAESEVEQ